MNDEQRTHGCVHRSSLIVHRCAGALVLSLTLLLSACGSAPKRESSAGAPASPPARGGGYYLDDGPGANAPANLDAIPDAVPKIEPLHRGTQRPYTVMGRSYTPMTRLEPYRARGIATWYGRRYHGKSTASGEPYDMYAMTAAHTVLPIPSYVRVTNVANGRSVVVRVNDRGPFIGDRLIDLSYTAAHRLGIIGAGSGMVEVESIIPGVSPAAEPPVAVAPAPAPVIESAPLPPAAPVTASPLPASAPAPAATTAAAGGTWLQFGAFGVQANAETYLARLQAQADWLAGTLRIHHGDGLFRVQAGPFASDAAAREAAERAAQALGAKPVVVSR
ncbi:MAG: septal ring lytic transglycosylase RlpA family protein [Burkholderiales bacterium]|jgi:rare lipoprotein A|nr:septal ring lytic transglycosylase RlpA family protein [Burkholderiales bacterium]